MTTPRSAAETQARIIAQLAQPIQVLLADKSINEIMINRGANDDRESDVWVEANGRMYNAGITDLRDNAIASMITVLTNANAKEHAPTIDLRMPNYRIAAAKSPIAVHGPMLCLRRHSDAKYTLDDYVAQGVFNKRSGGIASATALPADLRLAMAKGGDGLLHFLKWAVQNAKNLCITGSTGSGKTTLVKALIAAISAEERLLTIEDTHELRIDQPHYVQFESNAALGVTARDLIRLSLRCRPTRVIVGESRGAEAFELLKAMNTGHPGGIVTFHSDNAHSALPRFESMCGENEAAAGIPLLELRKQIANTLDYALFMARTETGRGVIQIVEVLGVDDAGNYKTNSLFDCFNLPQLH